MMNSNELSSNNFDLNETDIDTLRVRLFANDSLDAIDNLDELQLLPYLNASSGNWWNDLLPDNEYSRNATLFQFIFRAIGVFISSLIIITTIFGNTLVIIVVKKFHKMKTVTNILLASLAMADITVALLVMPFQLIYDYVREFPFGPIICHFWISCDVMCCTASLLHLCAVAIDRYFAITNPLRYKASVNKRRLFCSIAIIWLCSITISFVPVFCGWFHDGSFHDVFSVDQVPDCGLKVNLTYAIISSTVSFYLPLHIMLYVYFQILIIAERQSREIRQLERSFKQNGFIEDHHNNSMSLSDHSHNSSIEDKRRVERNLKKRAKQILTETKAIRTLGISAINHESVLFALYSLCWLPYFIAYVALPLCGDCEISYETQSVITWLGFVNSSLNPCIYALLNKEFKNAFRRVLCCTNVIIENDLIMDEMSTASRSVQRSERCQLGFEMSASPCISRTPSATAETINPCLHLSTDPSGSKLALPNSSVGRSSI
ncbi:beta-2 adrenergic receptor-like protein, partial [Leptotrombidium deliense]